MFALYVDDVRTPNLKMVEGDILVIARNYNSAIDFLNKHEFDIVFLDHDLGEEKTGYDIATWIEEKIMTKKWNKKIPILKCHSANPVGRERINMVAKKIAKKFEDIKRTKYEKI